MAERSIAGRVRRAVAGAAAATRLVGSGPDETGAHEAPEAVAPAPDAPAAATQPAKPAPTAPRKRSTRKQPAKVAPAAGQPTGAAAAELPPAKAAPAAGQPTSAAAAEPPAKAAAVDQPTTATKPPTKAATAARPKRRPAAKRAPADPSAPPPAERSVQQPPAPRATPASAPDDPAATPGDRRALVVQAHEEPWTPEEIEAVRRELQDDLDRLRAEVAEADAAIADLLQDPSGVGGEDQADAGSKTFEREHEMALAASHREVLAQAERALVRLEEGTLGICESCGNPIGKARVQAFPRATLCLTCKQREERR
jgi:RNA polymerase-binding transcription factor DksA